MTRKPRWMQSVIEAAKAQKGPVLPHRKACHAPAARTAVSAKA